MGATGAANDEGGGDGNIADGQFRVLDAFKHCGHGNHADAWAVLVDGGEWDGEEAGIFDVVHADDTDFFRDADSEGDKGLHEAGGGEVVGADDGFRAGMSRSRRTRALSSGLPRQTGSCSGTAENLRIAS